MARGGAMPSRPLHRLRPRISRPPGESSAMHIEGALRTRALYVLATFAGVCAGLAITFTLIGRLTVPTIYAAFGAITGVPVCVVLWSARGC